MLRDRKTKLNIKQTILLTLLILLTAGCSPEWKVDELYSQPISGTSKLLYKYDAWGGFDSHSFGYRILDSTETFAVNSKKNLPFYFLEDMPRNKKITGVSHRKTGSDTELNYSPIDVERFQSDELTVIHRVYETSSFSKRGGGYQTFSFADFEETADSLFFFDLDLIITLGERHIDTLRFKKKSVVIRQNEQSEVSQIVIEDLVLDKETGDIISNVTWALTPKKLISSNRFSNYGIFKVRK